VATGSGNSIGAALLALAAELGGAPRKSTYTAKGWHAQISRLTATKAGYEAADAVGLDVTPRTLRDWLAERVEPSPKNRALIDRAYRRAAGLWPGWERMTFKIWGDTGQGGDRRTRGSDGNAPLRVEGADAGTRVWVEFQEDWESGNGMSEDDVEEHFASIVQDAIGGSEPWEFPGSSYTVTAH
jgi:hypothetical protein